MQPVILDTDVASLLHRRKLTGPLATRLIGREPLIIFITFGELAKWAEIRCWGADRRGELACWLSGIPVLPGDEAVAAIWGRLSAAASRRGRPRPVNDMWIAACCSPTKRPRHLEPQGLRGLHRTSRPADPRGAITARPGTCRQRLHGHPHPPRRLPLRQASKLACNSQKAGSVRVPTAPASRPPPPAVRLH